MNKIHFQCPSPVNAPRVHHVLVLTIRITHLLCHLWPVLLLLGLRLDPRSSKPSVLSIVSPLAPLTRVASASAAHCRPGFHRILAISRVNPWSCLHCFEKIRRRTWPFSRFHNVYPP
ncbi:hypothetical protein Cob_v008276 [Colletotrichum orbiculare MAFF 240422]|uniref:Uncharacterized protein n=1 Tax=Colletotrichum orbiculare (strain 104-T / ATCC 96160 / CBS 514.97 / LARS 414 / MAFF 240422) TaxID=1213857 RepID=A0A484FKY6_COLOR|nr:hypothetical protein Cob_v008276 [Colletotrichum orbiculare MAFF 240422]